MFCNYVYKNLKACSIISTGIGSILGLITSTHFTNKVLGSMLIPFIHRAFSINTNAYSVLFTSCNLLHKVPPAAPLLNFNKTFPSSSSAAIHHYIQVSTNMCYLQTCNIFCKVRCMRSNIAPHPLFTITFGICSPCSLHYLHVHSACLTSLWIFNPNLPYFSPNVLNHLFLPVLTIG